MLKIHEHTGERSYLCVLSLVCLTLLTKALQFLDASSNCLPHTLGLLDPADEGTKIS